MDGRNIAIVVSGIGLISVLGYVLGDHIRRGIEGYRICVEILKARGGKVENNGATASNKEKEV